MINYLKKYVKTGDNDFREIIKHSAWALALFVVAALMQFVFDLLLARNFGAEGTGIFYMAFSMLTILALVGRLGLNRAVVRYIPKFVASSNWSALHGLKRTAFGLTAIISTLLGVLVFLLAPLIAERVFGQPQITNYLRIFAITIPPFSMIYVQAGFLRGLKLVKESVILERIAIYLIASLLLVTFGRIIGLDGVILGFALAVFLTALFGVFLLRKALPKTSHSIVFNQKTLLLVAAPLLFVEFSNQMTGQLNIVVLGVLGSPEAVGIFNIALKISMLISVILTGINMIATTKVSELYSKGNLKALDLMASKTAGLALLCGLPLMLFFFLFPEFVLGFFGAEFTAGATVLRILVLAQIVNLGVGSVTQILAMTGHERILAFSIVSSVLVLNAVLSIILIPIYGIVGAGIAVACSIVVKNIVLLYLVKKYLNIWSLPFRAMRVWAKNF